MKAVGHWHFTDILSLLLHDRRKPCSLAPLVCSSPSRTHSGLLHDTANSAVSRSVSTLRVELHECGRWATGSHVLGSAGPEMGLVHPADFLLSPGSRRVSSKRTLIPSGWLLCKYRHKYMR